MYGRITSACAAALMLAGCQALGGLTAPKYSADVVVGVADDYKQRQCRVEVLLTGVASGIVDEALRDGGRQATSDAHVRMDELKGALSEARATNASVFRETGMTKAQRALVTILGRRLQDRIVGFITGGLAVTEDDVVSGLFAVGYGTAVVTDAKNALDSMKAGTLSLEQCQSQVDEQLAKKEAELDKKD